MMAQTKIKRIFRSKFVMCCVGEMRLIIEGRGFVSHPDKNLTCGNEHAVSILTR